MGLLTGVSPAVAKVIRDAVNDRVLSREIIYKRYVGPGEFDEEAGHPTANYDPMTIRAAALTHTERSVSAQGLSGNVQAGDHVYLIKATSLLVNGLTQDSFSQKDIIVDGGEERKITNLNWALQFAVQVTVLG